MAQTQLLINSMKRLKALCLTAAVATSSLIAPAAMAKPWRWGNAEGHLRHYDISPKNDGTLYLVVHSTNTRWIGRDRLRIEFSLRNNTEARNHYTYNPEVLYDEFSRCDHGRVCDPPLMPVVDYTRPFQSRNRNENRWYVHSATVDCKRAPYIRWVGGADKFRLRMHSVCDYFRENA